MLSLLLLNQQQMREVRHVGQLVPTWGWDDLEASRNTVDSALKARSPQSRKRLLPRSWSKYETKKAKPEPQAQTWHHRPA